MVAVVAVGDNKTLIWGMTTAERIRRIAAMHQLPSVDEASRDGAVLLVNSAFVFDPELLRLYASLPGSALTLGGVPIIAHCRDAHQRANVEAAMIMARTLPADCGLAVAQHECSDVIVNPKLRKREQPFVVRLSPETSRAAERASYFGAYKGVTDILTKYLWPEWALALTRLAARRHLSPNMVTSLGAVFCVAATILFWRGDYWIGMAAGLAFMVLDTVDGKLARCTITSSKWGNLFDHGLDQIHPPFWWYAWGIGLASYGRPLAPATFHLVMIAVVGGYVAQRLIERCFKQLFGLQIHVWTRLDSFFRLITARRNPNMVILFVSIVAGRADVGLIALAWWTVLSCLFHLARLVHALLLRRSGYVIRSWLG